MFLCQVSFIIHIAHLPRDVSFSLQEFSLLSMLKNRILVQKTNSMTGCPEISSVGNYISLADGIQLSYLIAKYQAESKNSESRTA